MKPAIAYKGGPHAVEEALELIEALVRPASRAASRLGNVVMDSHRLMVSEWSSRVEPQVVS